MPLLAQIMGIVDVFDALTTPRPYKPALPLGRAYEKLMTEVERGWRDRELVRIVIALGEGNRLNATSPAPAPDEATSAPVKEKDADVTR